MSRRLFGVACGSHPRRGVSLKSFHHVAFLRWSTRGLLARCPWEGGVGHLGGPGALGAGGDVPQVAPRGAGRGGRQPPHLPLAQLLRVRPHDVRPASRTRHALAELASRGRGRRAPDWTLCGAGQQSRVKIPSTVRNGGGARQKTTPDAGAGGGGGGGWRRLHCSSGSGKAMVVSKRDSRAGSRSLLRLVAPACAARPGSPLQP